MRLAGAPIALLLALPLLVACPQRHGSGGTDVLVVVEDGSPATLDPRFAADAWSIRILDAVLRRPLRIAPGGVLEGDLARSWHWESPTRLVLELATGARFHDGAPLDATAVAATLDWLRNPAHGSPHGGALQAVQTVRVEDRHLILDLREPDATLPVALAAPVVHPQQLTAPEIRVPIGSGPYRLTGPARLDEVELAAVRTDAGAPQRVLVRAVPDSLGRAFAMESGAAGLAQNCIAADDLPALALLPHLAVRRRPGANISYLAFHADHPQLGDPRVRRAIATALPRQAIAEALLGDTVRVHDTLLPPEHWADTSVTWPAWNPAAAEAALDAAGWPRRGPNAREPRFLLEYKTSTNPERVRIAHVIAAELGKVGIEVRVRSLEFGTLFADILGGRFDMYALTWVGVVEPDLLRHALHSAAVPPAGANRGHFADALLDDLLERGRRLPNPDARAVLYRQALARIAELAPVIPLWAHDTILVHDHRLQGFEPGPGGGYGALAQARWSRP